MEEDDEPEVIGVAATVEDPVVRAGERLFRREYDGMVRFAYTLLRRQRMAERVRPEPPTALSSSAKACRHWSSTAPISR